MTMPIENVWDYPRPPRLEAVPQELRIVFAGETVAVTRAGAAGAGNQPPAGVLPAARRLHLHRLAERAPPILLRVERQRRLLVARRQRAHGRRLRLELSRSHRQPSRPCATTSPFIPAAMDRCTVEGETVLPQPGGFYGGWITGNLRGPFKGEPGTMHW